MDKLKAIVTEFEGNAVTTLVWNGRPVWIAGEIGAAIGYAAHGKRFVTQITCEWADEFIPGRGLRCPRGRKPRPVQDRRRGRHRGRVAETNTGLVVLYESGLHMALTKTSKPIGRRLRRFLVEEVLPQIVRTGRYEPVQLRLFPGIAGPVPTLAERREVRLRDREVRLAGRLELDDRKFRVATIHRTVEVLRALGRLDDNQLVLLEVSACEIALGFPLIHLYPPPVGAAVAAALGGELDDEDMPVAAAASQVLPQFAPRPLLRCRRPWSKGRAEPDVISGHPRRQGCRRGRRRSAE